MAGVEGVHQVVFALREHGADMERGVQDELDVLAQMAARTMRRLAPKHRSLLTNSIHVSAPDAMTREVRPGAAYAEAVEKGVKPGGKGLPRFFDPASKGIVDWLQSKAFAGQARVRKGTGRFSARELMLRDRYEGLALHVRKFGVKAQPFVEPTAREMEPIVLSRMNLAVRRVLALRPDAGGAVA
ncbi:MAG: hypothetical protein A3E79_11755 [Burkholderiales bacterium RIFCSPHIGHO2_12_FULL_61_11]|nr:MAG: hypothetical protein A3E79_11755 [Burkholderiales bacterium RIFCSPHIGHO2_12_FULL_61_11]